MDKSVIDIYNKNIDDYVAWLKIVVTVSAIGVGALVFSKQPNAYDSFWTEKAGFSFISAIVLSMGAMIGIMEMRREFAASEVPLHPRKYAEFKSLPTIYAVCFVFAWMAFILGFIFALCAIS